MATTTRFAVVNNVNDSRSRFADFDIHVEGCKALAKLDPRDIDIIEAADAADAEQKNNAECLSGGDFDPDSRWSHRTHSCVKKAKPAAKSGATGPRYSDAQIKAGLAAKAEGKSRKAVAEAAGVKSPNYFNSVLVKAGAEDAPAEKATTKEEIAADSAAKTRSTGRRGRKNNGGGSKRAAKPTK